MSESHAATPAVIRRCDVAIIGGSPAGLAAALEIARQEHSVMVIEANNSHLDGTAPSTPAIDSRDEVRRNGGEVLTGRVAGITRDGEELVVDAGNVEVRTRWVLAVTGSLPNLGENWGDSAAHANLQFFDREADGVRVGAHVASDLSAEDRSSGADRRSANEIEWNQRYAGEAIWSGAPNGTLVAEIESMNPGRVLDIGAGEGGDAVWLAERGWQVTATDIASSGLDRLRSVAAERLLTIECLAVDANQAHAFGNETYDLVSLFYCAIPRTGDDRAITNMLDSVAPGGTLLMVGHAPPADTDHVDPSESTHDHTTPWDRHSFVNVDAVAAAVRAGDGWTIEIDEVRNRPAGSASHHHHDTDQVLRARRHPE